MIYEDKCEAHISDKCVDLLAYENLKAETTRIGIICNETIKTRYMVCSQCFALVREIAEERCR